MFFASKESQMMSQRTGWFDNDTAIIHLWMIKGTTRIAAPAGHVVVVSARCCQNVERSKSLTVHVWMQQAHVEN
jgi:hypothetical protein